MIRAVHTIVYSDDPEATRAFFRDVLGWPHVDVHDGWLIFKTGPSEMGVHPTSGENGGQSWTSDPHHEISLMCDDIEATVAELTAKGVAFTGPPASRGFGLVTTFAVPGAGEMMVYQPRHLTGYDL